MSLYYGVENSADCSSSFTCPYCAQAGFSEQTLQEHVNSQHADQRTEVVCPICASLPDGNADFVSDDFPEHLAIEHQAVRELDDSSQRLIRRIHHQRGGRLKGYHRLYASNTYQASPPSSNSACRVPLQLGLSLPQGTRACVRWSAPGSRRRPTG